LAKVNNHFALVVLAAERARQLAAGATPLVICDNRAAVTSLREIALGKVTFRETVDAVLKVFIAGRQEAELDRKATRAARRRA
jgi:DNA-directed RNA polymerase subunit omega